MAGLEVGRRARHPTSPARRRPTPLVDLGRGQHPGARAGRAQSDDIDQRLDRDGVRIVAATGGWTVRSGSWSTTPDGGEETLEADVVLHRDRGRAAHAADRAARRRADPHLGAGLRPRRAARAPDRRRVRGDRRRVRRRLQRARHRGHAGQQPRPGAAGRGRRRRRGARGGLQAPRHDRARRSRGWPSVAPRRATACTVTPGGRPRRSRARTACSRSARCRTPTGLGLEEAGVELERRRVRHASTGSRARRPAGSTPPATAPGVLMLASVAAMQGRIAMWHALGDAVAPLDLQAVSSNVFTAPEIATVGWTQSAVDAGEIDAEVRDAAAGHQRAGQDAGRPGRLREAVLPARHRHHRRRRRRGAAGQRADPRDRDRGRRRTSPSTSWPTPSPSTPR